MASIQHSFSFESRITSIEIKNVFIEIVFPKYSFRNFENGIQRFADGHHSFTTSHDVGDDQYSVHLPLSHIVGSDDKEVYGFFLYHFIEILSARYSINDFGIPFTIYVRDGNKQEIYSETFEGIFYRKKSHSSDYDSRNYDKELTDFQQLFGPLNKLNSSGLQVLATSQDRQVFLINKKPFELLKYYLGRITEKGISDLLVLELVEILTDLSEPYPQPMTGENTISLTQLVDFFQERQIPFTTEMYEGLIGYIDTLFDFPLSLPEIKTIDIIGNLEIVSDNEVSLTTLNYYDLQLEYVQKDNAAKILKYNWRLSENEINDNSIGFSFEEERAILVNNVRGMISVKLKGFDGAVLWEKAYDPSDEALQNIQIRINSYPLGGLTLDPVTQRPLSNKRLRGKVLQQSNKHQLNDLTIVVQVNDMEGQDFRIVASSQTDNSGNFSMNYPYGNFTHAQVSVSLMPNFPAELSIDADRSNETISDDFIYLLLSDEHVVDAEDTENIDPKDDCECDAPNKAKRLPDQEDLINSDEYTQDMGGGCVNLSTPNRTLREYSYNAIVRTSDPDVANYVLNKTESDSHVQFELVRKGQTLKRMEVNLENPIRWEDAPDAKENLSLYQAVTVATGHILHFKSVFKADGYSLGDLVYSLPLAPGQKKQIVVFESSHSLQGAESQSLSQGESLSAELLSDRSITDQLGGDISENLSGQSRARTAGFSGGLGAAGSFGGIGASLGIAGGVSNSRSSASQNSSRNISQFFGEKLRQSLTQNAESYRNLNASVVTTVNQDQDYGVTAEVVSNHNHCHSLTMMYFEVLRHYAIFQEISSVEECVFVPLLLTHFSTENIHKWKDVLAQNLLSIPSNTYLRGKSSYRFRSHPLLKAFDAIERIKTDYTRVDFPPDGETYADGEITHLRGRLRMNINIPRPKTKYDRIKSMPIVTRIVTTREFDPVATAKSFLGPPWKWGKKYRSTDEEILERAKIFDQFMQMDDNFQTVPAAQCIRITNFQPVLFDTTKGDDDEPHQLPVSGVEFFDGGHIDKLLWETYAKILGYVGDNSVYDMLDYYYKGRLIAEWDDIFYNDMLPLIFARITDSIAFTKGAVKVEPIETPGQPDTYRMVYEDNGPALDISTGMKYTGGNKSINVNFSGTYSGSRRNLSEADDYLGLLCTNDDVLVLKNHIKLNIGSVSIDYTTDYFQGSLYRGYVNDDLLDGTNLYIPLTQRDETSPRKEDIYIANTLIEHLNSNIEHYNKVLWSNLDSDRRYMLLDGFHIQTFAANGDLSVMRSLASVVKNQLISVAGNSLVFPVADGYRVGRDSMLQEAEENGSVDTSLLDYYKPLTPMKPYRLSVPTRGVFMEAIQGNCDACEMVKENSSQDWDKFRTEEPTTISPVVTPTPTVTEYRPNYKDFASPVVNIQNAPDAPAPAAGLSQLGELLGKSDVFKDITGLEGNQKNVLETFKANTQAAQEYAKMASSLATQQHNTQHSPDITDRIEQARSGGSITDEDARNLTRQHLQQQIEGGEASREAAEFSREQGRTSLSDVAAIAANRGQSVEAERTGPDGINERIQIGGDGNSDIVNIVRQVQSLSQEKNNDCWAVAATIMMNWKSNTTSSVEDVLRTAGFSVDPENEEYYLEIYNADNGLLATEKNQFINSIGMDDQPPANFTAEAYINWLETFGPLWITTDGDTDAGFSPHARILYQINGDRNDLDNLTFHFIDPLNGQSIEESFTNFISRFEQVVTDIESSSSVLFSQVVMFTSPISTSRQEPVGEGQAAGGPSVDRDQLMLVAYHSNYEEFRRRVFETNTREGGPSIGRRMTYRSDNGEYAFVLAENAGLRYIHWILSGAVDDSPVNVLFFLVRDSALNVRRMFFQLPDMLDIQDPEPVIIPPDPERNRIQFENEWRDFVDALKIAMEVEPISTLSVSVREEISSMVDLIESRELASYDMNYASTAMIFEFFIWSEGVRHNYAVQGDWPPGKRVVFLVVDMFFGWKENTSNTEYLSGVLWSHWDAIGRGLNWINYQQHSIGGSYLSSYQRQLMAWKDGIAQNPTSIYSAFATRFQP